MSYSDDLVKAFEKYCTSQVFDLSFTAVDENTQVTIRVNFAKDGQDAGHALIYFTNDNILIFSHQMADEYQGMGSYILFCRSMPFIAREFGYNKVQIASTTSEPPELQKVHEDSGFYRVNESIMEVDVSQPNSKPELYASGKES